jgi:hypothetical protein
VAIVGGTVRDLLGGKSGKDIVDMTISQTYATLGFALTDFFNSRGREVTERILLTETSKSRFGQMKDGGRPGGPRRGVPPVQVFPRERFASTWSLHCLPKRRRWITC